MTSVSRPRLPATSAERHLFSVLARTESSRGRGVLERWLKVRAVVPQWGGSARRPLAVDRTRRARFPASVSLQATLFGFPLGELDVVSAGDAGEIRSLALRFGWMVGPVATRLLDGLVQLAPKAAWSRLVWDLDAGEPRLSRMAQTMQFRPMQTAADEITYERRLANG